MCLVFSNKDIKVLLSSLQFFNYRSSFGKYLENVIPPLKSIFGQSSVRYLFMFQVKYLWHC